MALCHRKKKASEVPCLYHGLPGIVYRDVRVYGYTTMAMHDNEYPPPPKVASTSTSWDEIQDLVQPAKAFHIQLDLVEGYN